MDHKDISEADMKRQAYKTWGNHDAQYQDQVPDDYFIEAIDPSNNVSHIPAFYRRVRSRMIAKSIVGYLKVADYEVLKNKAKQFTWSGHGDEEIDGPTILWTLLQTCNPSPRIGVAELKDDLRKATSAKFQNNVETLMDYMSSKIPEYHLERSDS